MLLWFPCVSPRKFGAHADVFQLRLYCQVYKAKLYYNNENESLLARRLPRINILPINKLKNDHRTISHAIYFRFWNIRFKGLDLTFAVSKRFTESPASGEKSGYCHTTFYYTFEGNFYRNSTVCSELKKTRSLNHCQRGKGII